MEYSNNSSAAGREITMWPKELSSIKKSRKNKLTVLLAPAMEK
jgi:hypothetical protein